MTGRFMQRGGLLAVLPMSLAGWLGLSARAQEASRAEQSPPATPPPVVAPVSQPTSQPTTAQRIQELRERIRREREEQRQRAAARRAEMEQPATGEPPVAATLSPTITAEEARQAGAVPTTQPAGETFEERRARLRRERTSPRPTPIEVHPPESLGDESAEQKAARIAEDIRKAVEQARRDKPAEPNGAQPPGPARPAEDRTAAPPTTGEVSPADTGSTLETIPVQRSNRSRPTREQPAPPDGEEDQPARGAETEAPIPAVPGSGAPTGVAPVAQDGRTEWFSFEGMPWEDVVRHFAKRLGKPLMEFEGLSIGGELTYVNPSPFTKEAALDELNFLLHLVGKYFVETTNHIFVVDLNQISQYLPVERTYPSVEAFTRDNLRDMEYALVYMDVKEQPAQQLVDTFGGAMPDYATLSVLPETNKIKIVALARDVRKFIALTERIKTERFDPRQTKVIKVKTNVRDVEQMVRDILGIGQRQPGRFDPRTRQFVQDQPQDETSDVRLAVDDRTNTLIIKATKEKVSEVEKFLAEIDKQPDIGEFKTKVVPVQYGNAVAIADLLNEIFRQEQGQTQPGFQNFRQNIPGRPPQRTNVRQPVNPNQPVSPQDIIVEDIFERAKKTIRMVADERTNSLIVYANDDGLKRVEEMLAVIDKPVPSNFRTFTLQHAEAEDLQPILQEILTGMSVQASASRGRTGAAPRSAVVLADEAHNALHVVADREEMDRVEVIIRELDVEGPEEERHVIALNNVTPSRVADAIRPLLDGSTGSVPSRAVPRRGRGGFTQPGRTPATSQLIPLDEAKLLIVYCLPEQWEKVNQLISVYDEKAVSDSAILQPFTITKGNPASIANLLGRLYVNYQHPTLGQKPVLVAQEGNTLYVQGIKPAIEEIAGLIAALDVEDTGRPLVILPLLHADAAQVVELVQPLLADSGAAGGGGFPGRRGGGGGALVSPSGNSVQAEPATNSLIIRADAPTYEKVRAFVEELDARVGEQQPLQKFFPLKFAQARAVREAVSGMFGGGGGSSRAGRFGGQVSGSQVKVFESGSQVVVEAPAEKMPEIEAFIAQLDDPAGNEIVIKSVRLLGADVNALANRMQQAFGQKAQRAGLLATFSPDPTTETILCTVSASLLPEIEAFLQDSEELVKGLLRDIQFRQLQHAVAQDAANWLQQQLQAALAAQYGRNVAQQVNVSADQRTNRVIVNGPQVAVKQAMALLDEFDRPQEEIGSVELMVTEARKLPGLDVNNIANVLNQVYASLPPRPDKLKATFRSDALTETLLFTAPKDMLADIDEKVTQFAASTEEMTPENQVFRIAFADANYIGERLREQLNVRIKGAKGGDVANRVNVSVDSRQNSVLVNAPRFAMPMAAEIVKQLDQEVEVEAVQTVTLELKYADPNEVKGMIDQMFGGKRAVSEDRAVRVSITNGALVLRAPRDQIEKIRTLVTTVDAPDPDGDMKIKMYDLKVLRATDVALQVQFFLKGLGGVAKKGQLQPGAFAEPTTNKLVVIAPGDQLPVIETLITQIEATPVPQSEPRAYALKNVKADQVARNVETMLKAKVAEREGAVKQQTVQTAVLAEPASNRLFVYAPDEYQELAASLVKLIDEEVEVGEIVHIIQLEQASAADLARSINDSIGGSRLSGGTGGPAVKVTADAASNAILVSGLPKDVARVEKLIGDLERSSATIPELQIFKLKYAVPADLADALKSIFGASKNPADAVTVTPDDYNNRLIVSANKRLMRQVEAYLTQLDAAPEATEPGVLPGGKKIYFVDIGRGDAGDIAYDVEKHFPDPEDGGPEIDSDWFGEYLTIKCRESEFPAVEQLVRQYEARAKVETKSVFRKIKGDASRVLELVRANNPDVTIEKTGIERPRTTIVEDLRAEGDEPPPARKNNKARPVKDGSPCLIDWPVALAWFGLDGAALPPTSDSVRPAPTPVNVNAPLRGARPAPQALALQQTAPAARTAAPAAAQPTRAAVPAQPSTPPPVVKREQAKITELPDGRVVITGPKDAVSDLEDAFDLLEEDLAVGEVIRIFRFKYGDVNAAAQILDRMFNERQMRVIQPQQPQQQQPQPGGRRGQGEGEDGGGRGQQGGLLEQMQRMMGSAGGRGGATGRAASGERVRIATDPGHNYLIVKCDESDLPEIRELLRELDIPPSEVNLKVFQLKQLDAAETAANLKEALGITKAQQRRASPFAGAAGGARGAQQQQQLLQILQQELVQIPGGLEGEAARIESVEIVANAITNSLLVSATPEVMQIIERVINEMEELEGRDVVVIEYFALEKARVDDVLPLLQEIFANTSGRGGRGGAGKNSPAQLGPVTISGDPRSNTLIFSAEAKDVPVVRAQIQMLDIAGSINEAETYVCEFGEAETIAGVVEAIFGGATRRGGGGGGPGGREAGGAVAQELRVQAEPATNTIVVFGPPDKRDLIFKKIRELDQLAKQDIRELPVVYADAEMLADKLMTMFGGRAVMASAAGGGGPGGSGGRGRRGAGGGTSGRVTIVGDAKSKKLLVRAPDTVYAQIVTIVQSLDRPSEQLLTKRFDLEHANAELVVDSVKQAMQEYIMLAGRTGTPTDFDAFTAVADPRTNSVVVVGSQETFAFVQQVLDSVDIETPAGQKREFRIFALEGADAATVAEAINALSVAGGAAGGGGARPGGRRGQAGGGGAPSAMGSTGELDVVATAEPSTNSILVFGKREDIDIVEKTVIQTFEAEIARRYEPETIPVQRAVPSQLASFIQQFMASGQAEDGRGGATRVRQTSTIIPNDNAGTLVVRGTQAEVSLIRKLAAQFDNPDLVATQVKLIAVPYGQDATALAQTVEQVVNEGERIVAQQQGREPRLVAIGADQYTNSIIVAGNPTTYGLVDTIVQQLVTRGPGPIVTRVIEFKNISAQDAAEAIDAMQRSRRGGSSTSGSSQFRPRGTGGGGGGGFTPANFPRQSTPAPAPQRPRGTRQRPGGGGGSWMWDNQPAELRNPHVTPAYGGVYIGVCLPLPDPDEVDDLLAQASPRSNPPNAPPASLLRTRWQPAQTQPADESDEDELAPPPVNPRSARPTGPVAQNPPKPQPAPAQPPAVRKEESPRALPAMAQPGPASQPQVETRRIEPQAQPPAVTGTLRGDVLVQPLDSRRIIVSGDANDLDFIEQILAAMETDWPRPLVEVYPLEHAKATALQPLLEQTVRTLIEQRTPTPGPEDRIAVSAEARSNSLIVSASETNMELIKELIAKLDLADPRDTQFKSVPLNYLRAGEAVALLQPTVQELAKIRELPANSQPTVRALDRTNSVLIVGTPSDISEIERLIEAVDIEIDRADERNEFVTSEMVLIALQNGQAEEIAKVLTDMIKLEQEAAVNVPRTGDKAAAPFVRKLRLILPDGRELPELDLERPIRIVAEKGTNSLIVYSSKKNIQPLREIVGVFDSLPLGAETDVRGFALKHAAAEQVAELLTKVFDEGKAALKRPSEGKGDVEKGVLPPVPPGLAAKGLPYNVVISHDARSNTVFVIGRKDAVLLAGGIISELDRATIDLGTKAFVLELKNIQATVLAEKLSKVMEERSKIIGGDKAALRDGAVIQPDDRSNALIIVATPETYAMVEDLALQLDTAENYRPVDTIWRRLKFADAAKLEGLLQDVFDKKKEASTNVAKEVKDTLSLRADPRSNSLMLTGTRDYLDEAEKLINSLDQSFDPTVVFRVRAVKLNSAANIAGLLTEMVEKALAQKDSKLSGTPIHVAADPLSDSLLLAASAEDMAMLERWIEVLDRPSEIGRMTRILPLRRGIAEEVAKSIGELFKGKTGGTGGGTGGTGGGTDLTVTHDATTNSVIAIGPPALVNDVADIVARLDDTTSVKGDVVRIFKLQQADAEKAGELLSNILEGRGGTVGGTRSGGTTGGGTREEAARAVMLMFQQKNPDLQIETLRGMRAEITVIADIRTNSLVVTAPPESMPLMESLIVAVDVPPDAAKIRVFPLRNGDAGEMVKLLEQLFGITGTGGTTGGGGTTRTAGATGDSPERLLTLEGAASGEGGRQELSFTNDVRTNSVIAAGTTGYLDLVEQLILELDSQPILERKTVVYSPRNNVAQSIADSLKSYSDAEKTRLQEMGEEISQQRRQEREVVAIANEDANTVIISYDPRFERDVLDIVNELDQPPPQVMIQVLIIELTMDNAIDLGVEFAFQDLQFQKAGPNDTNTFDLVGGTDVGAPGTGLGGFTFTITGADFNFLFRTLQNEGSLNVLSRPQIMAMDNQEATIEIINDVPYVTGSTTSTAGLITTAVAREEIGIKLTVTPQINPDGFVRMEISQEVSDLTDSTVDVGQGVTAPIFFRRLAETTVTVKDNETVVLGGLITSREQTREQKIPLIGDVPGLGLLFRNNNDNTSRTELLIVLTPRVVRTVEDYRELSHQERDRSELLAPKQLTNPLLNELRIRPEELIPPDQEELLEPGATPRREPAPRDDDDYGPVRRELTPPEQAEDPDSYDVPITLRIPR